MRLKDITTLNPQCNIDTLSTDVSFVPMESIRTGCLTPQYIDFNLGKNKYNYFAEGDLLIAKVTPCFENGNIAIAEILKEHVGFGSSELFVLRCGEKINNRFLFYLCLTVGFKNAACATMTGVAGLKRISPLFMRTYEVDLPSIADQSRIAKYLDTKTSAIDSRISVLEQKRDAYGRLKKSIINDAVTHGLNPNVKTKDSGVEWIGEIPEHWEVKRFKEFAYTTKGKQTEYLDEQVEGSEIVLTVETLRQDIPTFFNYAIMPDKKQYCTTDDLVVIWDGAGVGELLRAKDGILSSTIAKVTVDETKVLKEYLWLWRYKIEYTLKSIPTGMGIPHLNPTLLNNFMIPVPPLAEQKEIINVLSKQTEKLSDAITLLNAQIEKYKLLKRSLINEVITGQRAV